MPEQNSGGEKSRDIVAIDAKRGTGSNITFHIKSIKRPDHRPPQSSQLFNGCPLLMRLRTWHISFYWHIENLSRVIA